MPVYVALRCQVSGACMVSTYCSGGVIDQDLNTTGMEICGANCKHCMYIVVNACARGALLFRQTKNIDCTIPALIVLVPVLDVTF